MIYLDNNATTEIAPEVQNVLMSHLKNNWGNPSSAYTFGAREKVHIDKARDSVSSLLHSEPKEIIFTSCASESNSTVFNTVFEKFSHSTKNRIITTKVEHSSILENCKLAEKKGFEVLSLDVNEEGMIDLQELQNTVSDSTCLVSIMWANNETGVIFPVDQIAKICQEKNILFHSDAVQAVGKLDIDVEKIPVDYLSLSAHKIHGPKGIGALYTRSGSPISPLIVGGGQEGGVRGGTYNTAYIAGLGKAAEIVKGQLSQYQEITSATRSKFESVIQESFPEAYLNGSRSPRLPNTSNFGIRGVDSEVILNYLNNYEIFLSTGSACTSSAISPSHVITAMKNYERANEAIRLSLSIENTEDEINKLVERLKSIKSLI